MTRNEVVGSLLACIIWHGIGGATLGGPTLFEVRWYGTFDPAWSADDWSLKAEAMKRHLRLMADLKIGCDYFLMPAEVEQLTQRFPDLVHALREAKGTINQHDTDGLPTLSPLRVVKGKVWSEDVSAVIQFESHKVDPLTGQIVKGQSGGWGLMSQVFRGRMVATARFTKAPILAAAKQLGLRCCLGLAQDVGAPRADAWFMGMLNVPDVAVVDFRRDIVPWASGGADPFIVAEQSLAGAPSSSFRCVTIVARDTDFFAQRPEGERERLWAAYCRFLQGAKDRGLKGVTLKDILEMVVDDRQRDIPLSLLDKVADRYMKGCLQMKSERLGPPLYLDLGGDYLSLADAFQAISLGLAGFRMFQRFPERVRTRDILGPTATGSSLSGQKKVKLHAVMETAANLSDRMWEQVPAVITVEKTNMNPAEFLYLMCRAYTQTRRRPHETLGQDEALPIDVLPAEVRANKKADEFTRLQFWTYKPVRWK